ncbi:MAG: ABC transporter ATP-binding protein [Verrucomicrobia bacterium]|nr:ABC transporter ATP-binding protein [Verrucomicrobiota bacterium]
MALLKDFAQNQPAVSNLRIIFRFGWPYLRRYSGRFIVGILLGIAFGFSNAGFVWATKTLIGRMAPESETQAAKTPANAAGTATALDRAKLRLEQTTDRWVDPWLPYAGRPVDWQQFVGGLFFLPLLAAFRGGVGYLNSYCMAWVSERVVNDLRIDVLEKLTGLSLDFFNRSTTGDLLTRVNQDTASLQRCLSLGFADLVKEPITVVSILIGVGLIDWKLTLLAMVFFPVCVVPMILLGRKVRKASKGALGATVSQASLLVEMLSGIRVVKAFGLEQQQVARFRKLSRDLVHHGMKGARAREQLNPIIETISMFGLGMLVVYIAYQQQTVAQMVAFLTGMALVYTPIKKLASLHVLFEQTSVAIERLLQVFREKPTVRETADPKPMKSFQSGIVFNKVSFSYGDRMVLENLNLTIPRGMRLGVAGESGSGKSTLVNLLFRFYDPTHGTIRIDGCDLREVASEPLRRLMALVSQEVVLFDLSVAENIACGQPAATGAEVEAAARAAFAHEFIAALPQSYQTRVGERGVTLSGGQRQRIAIARAFVRDAPILVLDEATAALDSQSEAEVQAAIDRLAEHRTVICVAHRLSTLSNMDHIIVLSQGRIIEAGRFKDLLQAGGFFAAMASKQGFGLAATQ